MFLRRRNNYRVYEYSGDFYKLRVNASRLYNLFYLHDNYAAAVSGCLSHCRCVAGAYFLVHGYVSVFICECRSYKSHVYRLRFIYEPFLTENIYYFHQVFRCSAVELSALYSGVGKRMKSYVCNRSYSVCGNVPVHVAENALRYVVRLYFVIHGKLSEIGSHVPVSCDNSFYKSFMGKMV